MWLPLNIFLHALLCLLEDGEKGGKLKIEQFAPTKLDIQHTVIIDLKQMLNFAHVSTIVPENLYSILIFFC